MTATDYEALPALAEEAPAPSAGTLVMKFGGTSVADVDRLRAVAQRLVTAREAGNRVVAVLSAMGDTTDELVRRVSHRGQHGNDAVPGFARGHEPLGDRPQAIDVCDRRPAELHDEGAGARSRRLLCKG